MRTEFTKTLIACQKYAKLEVNINLHLYVAHSVHMWWGRALAGSDMTFVR